VIFEEILIGDPIVSPGLTRDSLTTSQKILTYITDYFCKLTWTAEQIT
jgi:hypothetical protein